MFEPATSWKIPKVKLKIIGDLKKKIKKKIKGVNLYNRFIYYTLIEAILTYVRNARNEYQTEQDPKINHFPHPSE